MNQLGGCSVGVPRVYYQQERGSKQDVVRAYTLPLLCHHDF